MTDIREKIDPKYKWDLTCIYKSEDDFELDMKRAEELIGAFGSHEADMISSAECLFATFFDYFAAQRILEKLYQYASRSFDVDTSNNKYQGKEKFSVKDNQ